ncbi:sugar ABC transporter substrate-binding protein [Thermobrachium celere]|uniref:sugar ABC transporter substrate-binding protein n=1 Tax=Thermobrachium celere TaxID=53422 RepID=UPI0019443F6B|nr:extracellular solute-binding protein [Thermobrachium celere]GFR36208.1 sugar ABC transporter substrate-binding protein [Thermobrachium celere]
MKLKKFFAVGLTLVLTAGLFAGCGKKESTTNEPKTLRVTMGLGEEEWKVMREDIFPEFEKANNCKIEAIQVESGDVVKKLEAMKQAGKTEIDLIAQDNMALAPLVEKGLVEDLSEFRSKIPAEIIPSLIKVGEFDGKLYFLPFRPNVEINFYNEDKFNKYGLKPPKTWEELLNVAKVLKEKEGIGKVGIKAVFDGNTTVQLFEFIRQAGGDPLVLNDEGSIKAYTFLKELWPYLSPDSLKADWNTTNRFVAEESMYLAANWPFGVNVIVKDGGKKEIKAYEGFAGPVKASKVLGGDVLGIPIGSPNKDLALKFIEYLMSKPVQEKLASKLAWPSARSDAYGQVEEWQKPYFNAINEAMKVAEPRPNLVYWADVDKALNDALKEIVLEGKDVKATLDKYHKVIEDAKQKAGK